MTSDPATERAKKELAAEREISDRSRAEFAERTKGKPTPTQEENDLAALGAHVMEKEDDGSGPDPNIRGAKAAHEHGHEHKSAEAKPSANYQTRAATPGKPAS